MNPNQVFPVLVDGDYVLHESNAICKYLLGKGTNKALSEKLYPANLKTRGHVDQWYVVLLLLLFISTN